MTVVVAGLRLRLLRQMMEVAMAGAKVLAEFAVVSAAIAVFAVEPLAFADILGANCSIAPEFLPFAAALFVLFALMLLPLVDFPSP